MPRLGLPVVAPPSLLLEALRPIYFGAGMILDRGLVYFLLSRWPLPCACMYVHAFLPILECCRKKRSKCWTRDGLAAGNVNREVTADADVRVTLVNAGASGEAAADSPTPPDLVLQCEVTKKEGGQLQVRLPLRFFWIQLPLVECFSFLLEHGRCSSPADVLQ